MRKTDWKEYFIFSKKERNAAIVLLFLMALFIVIPFFYHPDKNTSPAEITSLNEELAKRNIDTTSGADETIAYEPSEEKEVINNNAAAFAFDPNTLDAAGFKRLGLRDKTINTILNYRSKGGHFKQPNDLRKIYGLRKEDADRLVPYIQIAAQQAYYKNDKQTPFIKPKPVVIDINTATAEQWKALPAIGDALAGRIVKFRDKMGGFKAVAQVKQTYGLSDSAFTAIAPYLTIHIAQQNAVISKKININTASAQQLQSNSNIPEDVAKAIVIYRAQHGNYAAVQDIKKIVFINDEMYNKVAPYLTAE